MAGTRLATNAPHHWPQITVDGLDPQDRAARCLEVGASLKREFEANGLAARVAAFLRNHLFDDGILEVPIEVEEEGQVIPVFIYPDASSGNAGHFMGVRRLLKAKGQTAVYYCPQPMRPAEPAQVLRELGPHVLSLCREEMPKGEYAMWWPTEEQAKFTESAARVELDRIFRALDGVEPYLFTAFVTDLQLTEEPPTSIIDLPTEPLVLPVEGPDSQKLFFCVDREKGLSFAFHTQDTSSWYRDTFLRLFAVFVEGFTGELEKAQVQRLPEEQRQALGWWNMLVKLLEEKEAKGPVSPKIGVVVEE